MGIQCSMKASRKISFGDACNCLDFFSPVLLPSLLRVISSLARARNTGSMSLVDLDFGNKVPAGAASAVGAAAAARNYVVKPRLGSCSRTPSLLATLCWCCCRVRCSPIRGWFCQSDTSSRGLSAGGKEGASSSVVLVLDFGRRRAWESSERALMPARPCVHDG